MKSMKRLVFKSFKLYGIHLSTLYIAIDFIFYRAAAWIGYYRLLPDIIGYFPYNF